MGSPSLCGVFDVVVEVDKRIEKSFGKLICLEVCLKVSRAVALFAFGLLQ